MCGVVPVEEEEEEEQEEEEAIIFRVRPSSLEMNAGARL